MSVNNCTSGLALTSDGCILWGSNLPDLGQTFHKGLAQGSNAKAIPDTIINITTVDDINKQYFS